MGASVATDVPRLPELASALDVGPLEHSDVISLLVMERLLLFSAPSAGVSESDGTVLDESADVSMEEGNSLGNLNVSFPHQMSLSSSASGSGK